MWMTLMSAVTLVVGALVYLANKLLIKKKS